MTIPLWFVVSSNSNVVVRGGGGWFHNMRSMTLRHRHCKNSLVSGTSSSRSYYFSNNGNNNGSASLQRKERTAADVKSYLEAWVGDDSSLPKMNNNNNNNQSSLSFSPSSSISNRYNMNAATTSTLALSGKSYLIPTLRLHKNQNNNNNTIESLVSQLEQQQQQQQQSSTMNGNNTNNITNDTKKTTRKNNVVNKKNAWRCPVVLDLSAFSPDGSPHYVPPKRGFLIDVVQTLDRYGIAVLALATSTTLPRELEEEAIAELSLPTLLSSRGAKQQDRLSVSIQDIIQLVQIQGENTSEELDKPSTHLNGTNNLSSTRKHMDEESLRHEMNQNSNHDDKPVQQQHPDAENKAKEEESTTTKTATATTSSSMTKEEGQASLFAPPSDTTFVYHGSVRSGQEVSSPKGHSLVIMGSVNSGGEVLSDGNIFIFGKLRGRALAGLCYSNTTNNENNNNAAKIVATGFDPELVCIGDTFTTMDDTDLEQFGIACGEPVMVSLKNGEKNNDKKKQLVFKKVSL